VIRQTHQDAHVVSYAEPPLGPSWPKKKLLLTVGLMAGMMGGTGIAFLLEYFARGFRNLRHLESHNRRTCAGALPM